MSIGNGPILAAPPQVDEVADTQPPRERVAMSRPQSFAEQFYPEAQFGGFTRVDGTLPFFWRVQSLLQAEMVALDVGCGRGAAADWFEERPWERCRVLKGKCQKVIGIDVSEAGHDNPMIDEFRPIDGEHWPVESASIDLLLSNAVLEHVPNPSNFFAECERVLKPGGYLCIRTPNRWSYVSLIASVVPNSLHSKVVGVVQPGRKSEDVFPTCYRANTLRAVRRLLREHHFSGCVYRQISEPNHLAFSRWSYGMGVYMHRVLPPLFWPWLYIFGRRLP